MSITYCKQCLKKQQKINELEEEIISLKAKLRYQERTAKEGFFGSQSDAGARTREILMTVLHTLKKNDRFGVIFQVCSGQTRRRWRY